MRSPDLAALAQRLGRFLVPLREGPIALPTRKALLSRDGGACADDGARLAFDPGSPAEHRCPRCGRTHRGEAHHRAWIREYHLWLSERAIHLALVGGLEQDERLRGRAREILEAYVRLYPTVPNQDNVLGPTRLFFSTYLESIWLTQVVIAAGMLNDAPDLRPMLEPVVRESAMLIASFDEGYSNRQAWHDAALIAAGLWLGDETLVARAVDGPSGIRALLTHGVTAEGLWFEGENYHFFALRGMLLALELLRAAEHDLYADARVASVVAAMHRAPLDTLLPDLTLPARSDAPFGVSVRQPRFAELWELGRTRSGDERLGDLLAELYRADLAPGTDVGLTDVAEQERNVPAGGLARSRLGWKALLWMRPDPPLAGPPGWRAGSRHLAGAGVAVLRPGASRYVSVETGRAAGGHGHPDLLHVTLFWDAPALADFGTGSYVRPSLHWYRSALAHNVPQLAGVGQLPATGACLAFDVAGGWSWCRAVATGVVGPGARAVRTVVAGPAYVVDVLEVDLPPDAAVDLSLHPLGGVATPPGLPLAPAALAAPGASGHEHGYDAIARLWALPVVAERLPLGSEPAADVVTLPRDGERVFVASAPGPPGCDFADGRPLSFLLRRAGGAGRWVQVYATAGRVVALADEGDEGLLLRLDDGARERVALGPEEARITDRAGRTIVLSGLLPAPPPQRVARAMPGVIPGALRAELPTLETWEQTVPPEAVVQLGETHYRRSERPYDRDRPFRARVAVCAVGTRLCFVVDVVKGDLCFRPRGKGAVLDNEPPDIHSDGLQCYLEVEGWAGYAVIPDPATGATHVRGVRGTAASVSRVSAVWRRTERGYAVLVALETGRRWRVGDTVPVALAINEMYGDRERRAGQLVLSGEPGWVYLRGDREPPHAVVTLEAW